MTANQLMIALLISILTTGVAWAEPSDTCPEIEGYDTTCLFVAENPVQAESSEQIQLVAAHRAPINQDWPTVLVLNGGPGGAMNTYMATDALKAMEAWPVNLVYYDQRGIGYSAPLTTANLEQRDLHQYTIENSVIDIESLRLKLVGEETPIIVLGHSYGAHLAFAYAERYPEKVRALIPLAGAMDALGILPQPYNKSKIWNRITKELGDDYHKLLNLIESGNAVDPDGKPYSMQELINVYAEIVSSYAGQFDLGPEYLRKLIAANAEALNSKSYLPEADFKEGYHFDFDPEMQFSTIVNQYIICNEMSNPEGYDLSPEQREDASKMHQSQCSATQVREGAESFSVLDSLPGKINFPTLVIGGAIDPLIDEVAVRRDIRILKEAAPDFVEGEVYQNVGHQFLIQAAEPHIDLVAILRDFFERRGLLKN